MSFDTKSTDALTGDGTLSVSSDTRKHQLKIELYDSSGNVSLEDFGIAVFARPPGAVGFDYLDAIGQKNRTLIFDRIVSDFAFCVDAEFGFPADHTYKVFWNKIY